MIGLLYSAVRNVDVQNFQRFHEEQLEAVERITSGKAINRASDDVASMGYLSKMQAESLGSNQSIRNSNDAFSLAEVGDAALADCEEALGRMKEVAIQAMNGINNEQDIQALQNEFDEWKEVFAQVVANTNFGGTKILNDKGKWFQTNWKPTEVTTFDPVYLASDQVGSNNMVSDGTISNVSVGAANYTDINNGITTTDTFTLKGVFGEASFSTTAAQTAKSIAYDVNEQTQTTGVRAEAKTYAKLTNLTTAGVVLFTLHGKSSATVAASVSSTSDFASLADAINEKYETTGVRAELAEGNASIILSNNEGYDIGIESFTHTKFDGTTSNESIDVQGLQSDGLTASGTPPDTLTEGGDIHANVGGHVILKSHTDFTISASATGTALFAGASKAATFNSLDSATVDSYENAESAIDAIDGALNQVLDTRSRFGHTMQRLHHNASGLQNATAVLEKARSTKEDADFAAEMVKKFRSNYMMKTNISVASITNNMSKAALQLI